MHLTLQETARRVEAYLWVEVQLFEILGGWVTAIPEREVKLAVASQAHHHGWHAELWQQRLPRASGLETAPWSPSAAAAALFEAIRAMPGNSSTVERLVAVYRVAVPRVIAAYRAHLRIASPIADAALMRSLRMAVTDELEDWQEGEALLHSLLGDVGAVQQAADVQRKLESLVVGGGLFSAR